MKKEKVQRVLANARNAIRDGNHEKLYQVIAEITDEVNDNINNHCRAQWQLKNHSDFS